VLVANLPDRAGDSRESNRQLVPEPIYGVVGPRRFHGFEWKGAPVRKLGGDQSADEPSIDLDFVEMHLAGGQTAGPRVSRALGRAPVERMTWPVGRRPALARSGRGKLTCM
jgi:hypothetical protein